MLLSHKLDYKLNFIASFPLKPSSGAGDRAKQLRLLGAFPEDLSSFPSNHMTAQNCKSSFRGLYTYTCDQNTNAYKK